MKKALGLCLLILALIAANPASAATRKECQQALMAPSTSEVLIGYLEMLVEQRHLSVEAVRNLAQAFKSGAPPSSPFDPSRAHLTTMLIHSQALNAYLSDPALDRVRLFKWSEDKFERSRQVQAARDEASEATRFAETPVEFVPVPAGSFEMTYLDSDGEADKGMITLTHPFEVMSTLVTQELWVSVMGENPAEHAKGPDTVTWEFEDGSILLQPDHPIENISWWSAAEFANRLSELHGLQPVYDMSRIPGIQHSMQWVENGRLRPSTEYELAGVGHEIQIKINAPDGDVYRAEGYRLPTLAESRYLLSRLGTTNERFLGLTEAEFLEYAWIRGGHGALTRPVATTPKSFKVDGRAIHDLVGNVNIWLHDQASIWPEFGTDPVTKEWRNGERLIQHGWHGSKWTYEDRYSVPEVSGSYGTGSIGIRLVRTLR